MDILELLLLRKWHSEKCNSCMGHSSPLQKTNCFDTGSSFQSWTVKGRRCLERAEALLPLAELEIEQLHHCSLLACTYLQSFCRQRPTACLTVAEYLPSLLEADADGLDSVQAALGCLKIQQQGPRNSEEDAWDWPQSSHTEKSGCSKMRLLYNFASESIVDMVFYRVLRTYKTCRKPNLRTKMNSGNLV